MGLITDLIKNGILASRTESVPLVITKENVAILREGASVLLNADDGSKVLIRIKSNCLHDFNLTDEDFEIRQV
jgi:hypothetical protein